jgi:uncharacterized membrane protein
MDLSGNCLEDNNANTKLNIKELNLSNADSCINKNKEEKDLGNNTFIKVYTIIMFILTIVSILQGICLGTCMCHQKITVGILLVMIILVRLITYFILFGSLLIGIYKGKLDYMLVFKYGYLVVLILTVMDRLRSCTSKSENEENKNTSTNSCYSIFYLIIEIVYYVLTVNYINKYEAYLKN